MAKVTYNDLVALADAELDTSYHGSFLLKKLKNC